jgi:hypothetical protein
VIANAVAEAALVISVRIGQKFRSSLATPEPTVAGMDDTGRPRSSRHLDRVRVLRADRQGRA